MSWMRKCYSRLLIDNHITDFAPEFMTRFDPKKYVEMVKLAGVESSMVYACDHNGNCYYPTKFGHQHANLKGRDVFGETVALLRKEGLTPIAYYTSIYHNNSAKAHPAWRLTGVDGAQHGGRYWWCCPNNDEYAAFAKAQLEEIVSYDVDGVFNDMTFWPIVCVCPSCREKFKARTGLEIPRKIDWRNKDWIAFQRFREESMASFSQTLTDAIKKKRPGISVTHQTSIVLNGWMHGYTLGIAEASDYGSGDFYGGRDQHIIGAKVLDAISKERPFEFMNSRCVDLRDHTSMKSEEELTAEAASTIANGGAYFFIDAINPDGTLEKSVYERLGRVNKALAPFRKLAEKHVPALVADKALYYSSEAYVDDKGESEIMSPLPPKRAAVEELSGTASILKRNHIPFRVVHKNTKSFEGLDAIVMNSVAYTSDEENARLRDFVAKGGTLIATGRTSLFKPDGSTTGDFGLADVFGVSFAGKDSASYHYLSFDKRRWLVSCKGSVPLVEAKSAQRLAHVVEPHFAPEDEKYASIHSNPPERETEFVALSVNKFGKGKCVYLASPLLGIRQDAQQEFGKWLFKEFSPSGLIIETNAPHCVETTILKSSEEKAWLIGFVNCQAEMPNLPVYGLTATVKLPDGTVKSCVRASDGKRVEAKLEKGALKLEIEKLETIEMFEIHIQ